MFRYVFKDAWLYPLKQINDVLIPVRLLEHEIVQGVVHVGIWDILIARMLSCLFEQLKLDSVRAELLHVWKVLLHTWDPFKIWHESTNDVGIAVTDKDDGNLALGVKSLQILILQLRGIVNEEDHMPSFI